MVNLSTIFAGATLAVGAFSGSEARKMRGSAGSYDTNIQADFLLSQTMYGVGAGEFDIATDKGSSTAWDWAQQKFGSRMNDVAANYSLPRIKEALGQDQDYELLWWSFTTNTPTGNWDNGISLYRKKGSTDGKYVLAVAGTNTVWGDGVMEDLNICGGAAGHLGKYSNIAPSTVAQADTQGKVWRGTEKGCLQMTQSKGTNGQTLQDFAKTLSCPGKCSIKVVGHSLGASLSPTMALYAEDELGFEIDEVRLFAAPAPGRSDFVRYYDERLGAKTYTHNNKVDVVAYALGGVEEIEQTARHLYDTPSCNTNSVVNQVMADGIIVWVTGHKRCVTDPALIDGKHVAVRQDNPKWFEGKVEKVWVNNELQIICPATPAFSAAEITFQHIAAYYNEILGEGEFHKFTGNVPATEEPN